ncbi:Arabinose-proton symporter [Galdieria sulphuraria]|nr:Arabinose-proton symporter [Galdieria sulphuraria]
MEAITEFQQAAEPKNEDYDSTELQKEAGVTDLDDEYLTEEERLHPWRQTRTFYCGAQVGYIPHFGLENRTYHQGVMVSCIYFGCFVGVFIALFTNTYFGRRFTISLASFISTGACIWEAVSPSWQVFIPGRIILGFSYGMIGETAPVYLAEMSPASIRGAIVSLYQQVVTIGIFLAYLCNLIFVWVNYQNVGWRIMIGFPMVPSVIEMFLIWTVPESPRWLIKRRRYEDAKRNLFKLRRTAETAERDFVRIKKGVEEDEILQKGKNLLVEVIRVPYIRRALLIGIMEMLFQQMSGMNVFMNYIDEVFEENINMGARTSVADFAVGYIPCYVSHVIDGPVFFLWR